MLTEEQREYIIKKLYNKGIGSKTQDYILEYCEVNSDLYRNIIPIKDIIERVVNNLNENIEYYKKLFESRYDIIEKNIKLALLVRNKLKRNTIFHELDHMATSSKDNLKAANGNKEYPYLICGIDDILNLNGGEDVDFVNLNEAITEYKVMKYIMYLETNKISCKKYKNKSPYLPYIKVLSQLVDILGEDTIIKDQFYGDISHLVDKFDEEVQGKYNLFEIVKDMNQSVWSNNIFHPIRTMKAKKSLEEKLKISILIKKCTDLGIELSKEEMNIEDLKDILHSNYKRTKENKKIDFIPKVNVQGIPIKPKAAYKKRNILER